MVSMLKNLDDYYREKRIHSQHFYCPYLGSCKSGSSQELGWALARVEEGFAEARSAYVGDEYEKGTLPRLLFVSLDPGRQKETKEARTPEGIRKRTREEGLKGEWKHWLETHKLAVLILSKFDRKLDQLRQNYGLPDSDDPPPVRQPRDLEEAMPYFAHANSAKCCLNLEGNSKAPSILFENCRGYLKQEIEILEPDIVVTQGQEAFQALVKSFLPNSDLEFGQMCRRFEHRVIHCKGHHALWLPIYHPVFRQTAEQKKASWRMCADAAEEFIRRERRGYQPT